MSDTTLKSPARQPQAASTNPFAAALAETEKHSYPDQQQSNPNSIFSDALSKTGGNLSPFDANTDNNSYDQQRANQEQQTQALEEQRRERMRAERHRQINPVETNVYIAREEEVAREIEQIRKEVQGLIQDVKLFAREIDIEVQKKIVNPGQTGKYHLTLLQQLRLFVALMRKRIRSSGTWATSMNGKRGKRTHKGGAGLEVQGLAHEKTSTVQDMINNSERSTAYSGS